jgi:broad specificity phosphatase PhoE
MAAIGSIIRVLVLVRHATPDFGPQTPPEQWPLAPEGRAAAESLRPVLPPDALLVSSEEPKARQTLEPTGPVTTDARFNEVRRHEPFDGDFRARRFAYVTGADHPGWEDRAGVAARFSAGITSWQARCGDRPLVVASHGMAMTVWLSAAVGLHDPGAFWLDLRLPDVFTVDLAARTVQRLSLS